jgi:hypothetical protein
LELQVPLALLVQQVILALLVQPVQPVLLALPAKMQQRTLLIILMVDLQQSIQTLFTMQELQQLQVGPILLMPVEHQFLSNNQEKVKNDLKTTKPPRHRSKLDFKQSNTCCR